MKRIILVFLTTLFYSSLIAQNHQLTGAVTDKQGNPIPFASIFKANTNLGTSANSEGLFKLSLPTGEHQLIASAVGFKPTTVQIMLNRNDSVIIQLEEENYALQEVVIGNNEDPAYAMIRKAIKKRSFYLKQSGPYTANVYIKGLQRLLKAPKKFLE